MNCYKCQSESDFKCICKTGFCLDCGMKQGPFKDGKFTKCIRCVKPVKRSVPVSAKPVPQTIALLPTPKGWEEFFSENSMLIKTISKKVADSSKNATVYPPINDVFTTFNLCPPEKIKVVIIGQDCYHGPDQAHGLSFSVRSGVKPPPSLKNIFKEMEDDGFQVQDLSCGDLSQWVSRGVFLFNAALTVEQGKPGSHSKIWKTFFEQVVKYINYNCKNVVFILWGSHAQKCENMINNHKMVKSVHPSPLSAHNGFFGSKPFSKANELLTDMGQEPIDWNLYV